MKDDETETTELLISRASARPTEQPNNNNGKTSPSNNTEESNPLSDSMLDKLDYRLSTPIHLLKLPFILEAFAVIAALFASVAYPLILIYFTVARKTLTPLTALGITLGCSEFIKHLINR
eukprot:UN02408